MNLGYIMGSCPLHPNVEGNCPCCDDNRERIVTEPIGMGLWRCSENGCLIVSTPFIERGTRNASCPRCMNGLLFHVETGVFTP